MIVCGKIISMIEGDADRHHLVLDDNGQILGRLGDVAVAKKAELELHEKMETMVAEKDTPFGDAFKAVMGAPKNKALVQCYAGLTLDKQAQDAEPDPGMSSLDAGVEIDRRVKVYVHDHPETTYRGAMGFVLRADPELKATYEQAA